MTPKPITYSDHAAAQMKARRITRANVRTLIARCTRTLAPSKGRRFDYGGTVWQVSGALGADDAAVLFVENADRIHVITVLWVLRPEVAPVLRTGCCVDRRAFRAIFRSLS